MSETVRDRANGRTNLDEVAHLLSYAWDNRVLDYPIVRMGDSKCVLAVAREELVRTALRELDPRGPALENCSKAVRARVDAIVDAILVKLDLPEVEGRVTGRIMGAVIPGRKERVPVIDAPDGLFEIGDTVDIYVARHRAEEDR